MGFTAKEAAKTFSYWFLALATGFRIAAHAALVVDMVPILVWKGQPEVVAPLLIGIMSFVAVPLRFVTGYLSDVWSRQKVASMGMAIGALGVVSLLMTGEAFWQLALFVVLLAFAESVSAVSWALIGDLWRSFWQERLRHPPERRDHSSQISLHEHSCIRWLRVRQHRKLFMSAAEARGAAEAA